MEESRSIEQSFSLYAADMKRIVGRLAELKRAGVEIRRARFLRALVSVTPPDEMIALVVKMTSDEALGTAPGETGIIAGRPVAELSKADVEKLDSVKERLAKARIIATRTDVVRGILRALPETKKLASIIRQFLLDFPNKPRGLSKIRLARKARANG